MIGVEEIAFFKGDLPALAIYEALREQIVTCYPDCKIKVQKTQIGFSDRYGFAYVSQRKKGVIIATFGLMCKMDDARVWQAATISPTRCTHHVLLMQTQDVDAQLMEWIKASYALSHRRE